MQVIWKPKALKQLTKIGNKTAQASILFAASGLSAFPAVTGIKALSKHQYMYRMRVGSYRVLFDVATTVQVVSIEEVKKRDERTY